VKDLGDLLLITAAYLGAALTILAFIGWLLKPRVVQWAKANLLDPIKATERAVTVNGNQDPNNPTLKDDVGGLKEFQAAIAEQVDRIEAKVDTNAEQLMEHMLWSARQMTRIENLESDRLPPKGQE
jgi:hypothetical protein